MAGSAKVAILDLDGTLVDSNYHHAFAWYRAFREAGILLPLWRIHRHVGMGGDQLVPALAGEDVERERGDELRDAWRDQFDPLRDEIRPLPGAHELLAELHRRGFEIVLASSAPEEDLDHYLALLDAVDLVDEATTSSDVEQTKPAPDLVAVAREKARGSDGIMVGDSVWDVEAAARIDVPTIGVLSGGYAAAELREAGAVAVVDDPAALCARLDETPLARA
jgi:HAD superfamily hydrolase (TIGR01549 family)